ncbi:MULTISPECIES: hypothetical protein [Sphingomonas]|jgi:hypothetical protein|uniref:Uncharacterized protein n=2 Tax=Sphingomonas TaxID=13687 RepID=A0A2A4HY65_9SPHN|nr:MULTISPECIES: hypothetical protein [Sphingomonas]NJC35375.1 hypothetical protein [Sphingomonas jejuensis]PCG09822.1 hypothetical protein COA17_08270 [Sphingomonas ginsenosidimutans]
MAFIDFQEMPATGPAARLRTVQAKDVATPPTAPEPELRFDQLERQVLLLARRDGAWSLGGRGGGLDVLLKRLFGAARPNVLADPRLEALRRFAVTARVGGVAAVRREAAAFLAGGFTAEQRDAVLDLGWAR